MKKIKLDYSNSTGKEIIGIVCQKPDYWLVLNLNNQLHLKLRRLEDIGIYKEKRKRLEYFHFYLWEDDRKRKYYLLKNKNQDSLLLDKLRGVDYFFILEGVDNPEYLRNQIKKIQGVEAAIYFPITNIPKIEYFLEDLELHLIEIRNSKKNRT